MLQFSSLSTVLQMKYTSPLFFFSHKFLWWLVFAFAEEEINKDNTKNLVKIAGWTGHMPMRAL